MRRRHPLWPLTITAMTAALASACDCSGGHLSPTPPGCADPCDVGSVSCAGGSVQLCQAGSSGCPAWQRVLDCPASQVCVDGACHPAAPADAGADAGPTPDAGATLDAGAGADAGDVDGGAAPHGFVAFNACPLATPTPTCGSNLAGWTLVSSIPTTISLPHEFLAVWAPPNGTDVWVGGDTLWRFRGGTLTEMLDAGMPLGFRQFDGWADDAYALSVRANDVTRVYHLSNAGWSMVVRSPETTRFMALAGGNVYLAREDALLRVADGGLALEPLPPETGRLGRLLADPDGGLWIPASHVLPDGGFFPRVLHGQPGAWQAEDFPCLPRSTVHEVFRNSASEVLVLGIPASGGEGLLLRRLPAGWSGPELLTYFPYHMVGTTNAAWLTAMTSAQSGIARFSGCMESPTWLYTSHNVYVAGCGSIFDLTAGGAGAYAAAGACHPPQGNSSWTSELWVGP